jgi:AcrR family transcriptional regulator
VSIVEKDDVEQRVGRPCGPRAMAREQAILDAALSLVMEVGYDRLSMDALAERARAGKATIYRHWSGKAEVVVEAIRRRKCDAEVPAPMTGSLRSDLIAALECMSSSMSSEDSALLVGVLSAMQKDQELADLMRSQVIDGRKQVVDDIFEQAIAAGELPAGTDAGVINELLSAMFFNRLVISGEPIDETFIVHMVDDVILPLLHR